MRAKTPRRDRGVLATTRILRMSRANRSESSEYLRSRRGGSNTKPQSPVLPAATFAPPARAALVEAVTADAAVPNSARCLHCSYALRGLTSRRCPECGVPFDLNDPRTMCLPGRREPGWWSKQRGNTAVVWAITAVVAEQVFEAILHPVEGERKLFVLWLAVVSGCIARNAALRASDPKMEQWLNRSKRVRHALTLGSLALVLVLSTDIYQCPHGELYGICGVGVAHSTVGGPCRNRLQTLKSTHLAGDWYFWWS